VQRGGYYGRYLPSGHLVYLHDGTLFAAPFDLNRMEVTGQPVPALEGVMSNPISGGAQFAVSASGTLVYLPSPSSSDGVPIHWMDHEGKTTPLRAAPAVWSGPQFAPDGHRLAVQILDGQQADIWVYEWARDALTRLTFDPAHGVKPVWTPDGRRIVFASRRADKSTLVGLYWQRADGTGGAQRLTESESLQYPTSWHPSGKFLAFWESQITSDLMILPIEGDEVSGWRPGKPTVFLHSPFDNLEPMFSPDGRWVAYQSNESGRFEVYVRPFPGPGAKWQISTGGGGYPTWSRTKRELFYGTPTDQIMVAPFTVEGDSFRAEKPRLWSEARFTQRGGRSFDLHPDGERFALQPAPHTQAAAKHDKVVFIFNFFDELRRLAPVTKR
jgi:serine/threonine-protein kinase